DLIGRRLVRMNHEAGQEVDVRMDVGDAGGPGLLLDPDRDADPVLGGRVLDQGLNLARRILLAPHVRDDEGPIRSAEELAARRPVGLDSLLALLPLRADLLPVLLPGLDLGGGAVPITNADTAERNGVDDLEVIALEEHAGDR